MALVKKFNPFTNTLQYVSDGTATLVDRVGFGVLSNNAVGSGIKAYKTVPYDCSVVGWYIESGSSSSIEVDVKIGMITPVSLVGVGTKPILSAATSNSDASPDWDTLSLTEGDILVFDVQSGATATNVILTLDIEST